MSEQIQETLAVVLAEMRINKGFPVPFAPDWSRAVCTTDLVEYADRIEAAWKREREALAPEPDPNWKAICAKCHDGEIEPECEYYGESNGCNSPIYGEHPKSSAAMRDALALAVKTLFAWRRDLPYRAWHEVEAVIDTCNAVLKEGGSK